MKTKLLYVLVSSSSDIYLEQVYISIKSAKHHMPSVFISMLIDSQTKLSIEGNPNRERMIEGVDELISVDLPNNLTAQQRSRILKTSARQYIKGDYLFIDTDTIILGDLSEIDLCEYDIAACRDSHTSFDRNPYRKMCIRHCKLLGLDISKELDYYNSGVIYVKDTKFTHEFYRVWNDNWYRGVLCGVNMDQPAFAITNIKNSYPVYCLPDIWNCQIIHGMKILPSAKILHYLCTNSDKTGDIFILRGKSAFEEIKVSGNIPEMVTKCFNSPNEGIPAITYLQGGEVMNLLTSNSWQMLQGIYKTKAFKIIDIINGGLINVAVAIKKALKRIKII